MTVHIQLSHIFKAAKEGTYKMCDPPLEMMEPSSATFQYTFITILLVAFSFLNLCMCPL